MGIDLKKISIMFELKSYSRKELALLYFPDSPTAKAACMNFRRWMLGKTDSKVLFNELRHKKLFLKPDVKRIVELLGEP